MSRLTDDEVRRRYGLPPGSRVRRSRGPAGEPVRLAPDSFTLREVESSLEWAAWDRPVAVAGTTARLTVQGAFVGEGSPVEVVLKDARNRTVGSAAGAVYRDRAVVEVAVDRRAAAREPDGVLCAADVKLPELNLRTVSAPLLVLPYAELVGAEWSAAHASEGEAVTLSCRVTGTAAGVRRLEGRVAEVEVLRGDGGEPLGGNTPFEPVVTLRVPVEDGRVEVTWRVSYDAESKIRIVTQSELDTTAERTGTTADRYRRSVYRFRVRLAGLEVGSDALEYRDHVEFGIGHGGGGAYEGLVALVERPDGERVEVEVGRSGIVRIDPAPPGPYRIEVHREPYTDVFDTLDPEAPAPCT